MYETGFGGGYGGPPMPAEEVMTMRMSGRDSRREQHIVSELIPAVAHRLTGVGPGE